MDMQQILSDEEVEEKNVRLTCIGSAAEDEVKIVYNAKHLDYLQKPRHLNVDVRPPVEVRLSRVALGNPVVLIRSTRSYRTVCVYHQSRDGVAAITI